VVKFFMKKGSTVIVFLLETAERDKVEWVTKKSHQKFFDIKWKFGPRTFSSAVLTTGQTGHWPEPPSCRGPELQGSGNLCYVELGRKFTTFFHHVDR